MQKQLKQLSHHRAQNRYRKKAICLYDQQNCPTAAAALQEVIHNQPSLGAVVEFIKN